MSKTFTRKVHRAVIDKKEAEARKELQRLADEELKEAKLWEIGAKKTTARDLRLKKEKEKELRKQQQREIYEKEMAEFD